MKGCNYWGAGWKQDDGVWRSAHCHPAVKPVNAFNSRLLTIVLPANICRVHTSTPYTTLNQLALVDKVAEVAVPSVALVINMSQGDDLGEELQWLCSEVNSLGENSPSNHTAQERELLPGCSPSPHLPSEAPLCWYHSHFSIGKKIQSIRYIFT